MTERSAACVVLLFAAACGVPGGGGAPAVPAQSDAPDFDVRLTGALTCIVHRGTVACVGTGPIRMPHRVEPAYAPFRPIDLPGIRSLACSPFGPCCAGASDGSVSCWGGHHYYGPGEQPVRFDRPVLELALGYSQICARTADLRVACVVPRQPELEEPAFVPVLRAAVVGLGAGSYHVCALEDGGEVFCWGASDSGFTRLALGDGSSTSAGYPVRAVLPRPARRLDVGPHTCAIDDAGAVYCWGANHAGQLGRGYAGTPVDRDRLPREVTLPAPTRDVAVGAAFTCALLEDDWVWCWGDNAYGQLGNGTRQGELAPVRSFHLPGAAGVDAGAEHACAWSRSDLQCWGRRDQRALGPASSAHEGCDEDACTRPVPLALPPALR